MTIRRQGAAVDGEMVDVISNCAGPRSRGSANETTASTPRQAELDARGRSLRYLEKLRLLHAVVTSY